MQFRRLSALERPVQRKKGKGKPREGEKEEAAIVARDCPMIPFHSGVHQHLGGGGRRKRKKEKRTPSHAKTVETWRIVVAEQSPPTSEGKGERNEGLAARRGGRGSAL